VTTDNDGARHYRYELDGRVQEQVLPPHGWAAATATDEELARFHFPPKPDDPHERAQWAQDWAGWRGDNYAPPGLCQAPSAPSAGQDPPPSATDNATGNWGGVVASQNGSYQYNQATGVHRIPTRSAVCNNSSDGEASWVGLTRTASGGGLIQTGTYHWQGLSSPQLRVFYEYLTSTYDSHPIFPALTVSANDLVFSSVYYNSLNFQATFYNTNQTTGLNNSTTVTIPTQYFWDGTQAEWIDEKFVGYDLMKFTNGSIGWSSASAVWTLPNGTASNAPGNLPHYFTHIQNTALDEKLDFGLVTSANWNNYWHACW
jgi:hypothetical protein